MRPQRLDQVPLDVVGEVIDRIPPATYLERYEAARAGAKGSRGGAGRAGRRTATD